MTGSNQEDLADYAAWLRERRLASAKHSPHYARWVRLFLRFRGTRPQEDWRDSLHAFLAELGADDRHPDWQVQQAGHAVTLYWGQYRAGIDTEASAGGDRRLANHAEALAEMARLLELRHYAPRTHRAYMGWARRFLAYVDAGGVRTPTAMDVSAFLSHLATGKGVAAATQNQSFHALRFLCQAVLEVDLSHIADTVRARRGPKLPVVLTPDETRAVLQQLGGPKGLMLELLYGAGLRVSELVTLRVQDLDFDAATITVRAAKGDKDRITTLPQRVVPRLRTHLEDVRRLHNADLAAGAGEVVLPHRLAKKYPHAGREWPWQFVFPSHSLEVDADGVIRRWHVATATVQKAMRKAVLSAGISKPASVHTLRHAYATHLLLQGVDIRQVQDLLGHRSVETTMVYTHVMRTMAPPIHSPLDEL